MWTVLGKLVYQKYLFIFYTLPLLTFITNKNNKLTVIIPLYGSVHGYSVLNEKCDLTLRGELFYIYVDLFNVIQNTLT